MSSIYDIADLENEISRELDEFIQHETIHNDNFNAKLSAFEDDDKIEDPELTTDKIQFLIEDHEVQQLKIVDLEMMKNELQTKNESLLQLVQDLQQKLNISSKSHQSDSSTTNGQLSSSHSELDGDVSGSNNNQSSIEVEKELDLAKRGIVRLQQLYEEQVVIREALEKELLHERVLRVHAEKERDAYSAAYEASLKHFERWSMRKQLNKGLSPRGAAPSSPRASSSLSSVSISDSPTNRNN